MIKERFLKQIRDNIKKAVKESEETQNEIARQNNIQKGNLSRYLSGENVLSDKVLTRLAFYLKVPF